MDQILHPDISEFLDRLIPANDQCPPGDCQRRNCGHKITFIAKGRGQIAVSGGQNKNGSHYLVALIASGLLILLLIAWLIFSTIGPDRGDTLSGTVDIVAMCENKQPDLVHDELKLRWNYNRYTHISVLQYHLVMRDLSRRKKIC